MASLFYWENVNDDDDDYVDVEMESREQGWRRLSFAKQLSLSRYASNSEEDEDEEDDDDDDDAEGDDEDGQKSDHDHDQAIDWILRRMRSASYFTHVLSVCFRLDQNHFSFKFISPSTLF